MQLHVEFFVEDVVRSRDFYTRVLQFSVSREKPDGFTELSRGSYCCFQRSQDPQFGSSGATRCGRAHRQGRRSRLDLG